MRIRRCETRPRSLISAAYEAGVFKVSGASVDLLAPHTADIIYARKRTAEVVEVTHSDS